MSNLDTNPRADTIVRDENYVRYAGPYFDEYDNTWSVVITGNTYDVESIVGERRFVINAIPADQFFDIEDDAQEWQDSPEEDFGEAQENMEMPGLIVEIGLDHVSNPDQEHLIQIEFDPNIGNKPHVWVCKLNQPQVNFTFKIKQVQGTVTWSTSSFDGATRWQATVSRVSGNLTSYDMKSSARRIR